MGKFRRSHTKSGNTGGYLVRIIFIAIVICGIILWASRSLMTEPPKMESKEARDNSYYFDGTLNKEELTFYTPKEDRLYLAKGTCDQITHHNYYSLSYHEDWEQSCWVCYELTKASLVKPNVDRSNWYMEDLKITSGSASYHDYSRSEYSRGHLAPAGDMAFNSLAMKESFLMSNMSPQIRNFNGGVWNELEQTVRDWAFDRGEIAVCSGPVFLDNNIKYIGPSKVAVPHAFYKACYDPVSNESVAFVIPNAVSEVPLKEYAMTVDELEDIVDIDLFGHYYKNSSSENESESKLELTKWPFKSSRYQTRINKWNRR